MDGEERRCLDDEVVDKKNNKHNNQQQQIIIKNKIIITYYTTIIIEDRYICFKLYQVRRRDQNIRTYGKQERSETLYSRMSVRDPGCGGSSSIL